MTRWSSAPIALFLFLFAVLVFGPSAAAQEGPAGGLPFLTDGLGVGGEGGLVDWDVGGVGHANVLHSDAEVVSLGRPAVTHSARLGLTSRLARRALECAGWSGLESYRGYRAELSYPTVPCDLVLQCSIS